jgi:amino acid adenylation domain-containing protein
MSDSIAGIANLSPEEREFLLQRLRQKRKNASPTKIKPQSRDSHTFPLSFAQQRLWFLEQLEPGSPFYNQPAAVRLTGALNLAVLEQSFNEIVRRHEILRTTFFMVEGQPVQAIAPTLTLTLPVVDLQELPEVARREEVRRIVAEEARQPFNLAEGPLLRGTLLQLGEAEHILLFTTHHIICDGWSRGVLIRELAALYEVFSSGKPSPLPELPIQYADFAVWQRQWLQGEVLEAQLTYWKQQLAGSPPVLELPTDRPRPLVQTFQGATQSLMLPKDLTEALKDLSQQEDATLFMTLLAAFKTLLYRYTGQEDILVGTPIANRNRSEIERLIGFFVNTLVMRTDLGETPSFRELLSRVRKVALEAYARQDLPFEYLVDELQLERDLSHAPLFQVMFVFGNTPMSALELPGLTMSLLETDSGTAKFDLTLSMREIEQGLIGDLEYNTDLFDKSTIARMLTHFQTLLEGVVANPDQRLADLPLLTEAERQQLLVEWNDTQADYPSEVCLHQLFEAQVERSPDAIAVVFEDQQLTYRELNAKANQLAHHLQALGVGSEVLVGICVERSLEMVVGLLGILKAGGAYVPLDPNHPKERLAFILRDTQTPVLLTQQKLLSNLPDDCDSYLLLDTDSEKISWESTQNPISQVTSENLAYIIYTSGSTGQPKGTLIPHRGLVNYLTWCTQAYAVEQGTGSVVHSPLTFDLTITGLFSPLLVGRQVELVPEDIGVESLSAAFCKSSNLSLVKLTPAQLLLLSQQISPQEAAARTRALIIGGENLLAESVSFWQDWAPETMLVNEYGPTETVVGCCIYQVPSGKRGSGSIPIGKPIANTQLYVLNSYLQPVPMGVAGELYIGGANLARGYLNRPELSAEKFVPNPLSQQPGARLYKTGDLVRNRPDGNLEFLGRLDQQVKVRGFRIELSEIESLLAQHPVVREAVATVREYTPEDRRIVAYVVLQPEAVSAVSELQGVLKEHLPEYMMPTAIVPLNELPLTANGKVDRRSLPAPDLTQVQPHATFIAPSTPTEEMLAGIWAEILGLEKVGIHDNFFELGGHSLLATQVISRLQKVFQVELPLRQLFESPTVAGLAKDIETATKTELRLEAPPIKHISRSGELPLSFAQQRLWFLYQLEPDKPFYNIPAAVRLKGQLDVAALEQSINEILRRHEVLRTSFKTVEGQPVQVISPSILLSLPVIDLSELPEAYRETEIKQLQIAEAQQPFTLDTSPLLRVKLLRLGEEEHVALFTMHHIASDGWSMGMLMREVAALYQAFCNGQLSPLPELPIQYADFAAWQRQWLQGEVLESQLSYWRQQLDGAPAVLELPTDYTRPAVQTFRGATSSFQLSQELSVALQSLSQQEESTLFMTLLAAFKTLLFRYTGSEDIVVGSPIANRNRAEIEGLIGFFVNTLVLRTDTSDNSTFRELLRRVREVTLGAYAHQDLPFEQLVEELQPQRDLSHAPLFQVMFVLQNAPMSELELPGLTLSSLESNSGSAKFDLTLYLEETASGLRGTWEYNTDLFEAATIERMTAHLQTILEGIVANPEQHLSDLPLLTEAERQRLLVEWNDTQADYPKDQCIHQLFEAQVERTPDAVAVVFENQQLTYRELNQQANQLANHLQKLGVEPEVLVGICMERSLEMIVGLLGILKAGGAYVPLDPTYPKERLAFMLEDAQVLVLLTQARRVEALPFHRAKVTCLDADWDAIAQESYEKPVKGTKPENLTYAMYTSGSTGTPKGVSVPHRGVVRLVKESNYANLTAEEVLLQAAPISFDASTFEIWGTLLNGAQLVILPPHQPSLAELGQAIEQYNVTTLWLTAGLFHLMVDEQVESFKNVRQLLAGGDVLSGIRIQKVLETSKNCRLINGYGPTESTTFACCHPIINAEQVGSFPPIGRPISNTQVYVLDRYLQPVPIGVPGELHIGGDGLARGYLNRPELTAEKFIPNPFSHEPGAYLYKTGDLARYLPNGNIEFFGRIDNQVKTRGFRIELGEIEAVLTQHSAVQASVIVVREDELSSKRLVAYVVFQPEQSLATTELRCFLEEKLPNYMVPSVFVMLDALPLTPNGKVNRQALPPPEELRPESEAAYVTPQTELEQTIATVWQEVLDLEKVGIHDNFFELGGHSLLAIKVNSRLREILKTDLSILEMFKYPTISSLGERLSHSQNTSSYFSKTDARTKPFKDGKARQKKRLHKMQSTRNIPGVEE